MRPATLWTARIQTVVVVLSAMLGAGSAALVHATGRGDSATSSHNSLRTSGVSGTSTSMSSHATFQQSTATALAAVPTVATSPSITPSPPQPETPPRHRSTTAQPPAPSPPVPGSPVDRLVGAGLDTPVGTYSDCTGQELVAMAAAQLSTCVTDIHYFIGRNPGVFASLINAATGSLITWYDHQGSAHAYRIVAARVWDRFAGQPPLAQSNVVAEFQTSITPDGVTDRILDAVAA